MESDISYEDFMVFSNLVGHHQNLNCLTVNPGMKRTPDWDCAPEVILTWKISAF